MPDADVLLDVKGLTKYFPGRTVAQVHAVEDVSFAIRRGRTLGLVGESGCGKTTAGRTILRLLDPTAGEIDFDGVPVHSIGGRAMRAMRRRMQVIFQDPYGSLDPRMTVGEIIGEPLTVHGLARGLWRRERVKQLLDRVGLSGAHINHYPHEFSGGQRQRVGIARAIALQPDFIVCDEPVSALDVSIQAQIINLLEDLQAERGLSYLFISHDLGVVEHISHDVAVMYLGRIVELAPRNEIYARPLHPYTRALLDAIPSPDPDQRGRGEHIRGNVPSPVHPPAGCPFHPRCPLADEECTHSVPELREVGTGHFVRCPKEGEPASDAGKAGD
jgi:oligopeptide/dipeptide ABC transporter ATP-binding protein